MAVNDSQLVQLFEQVLTLSKVDASQSVAILKVTIPMHARYAQLPMLHCDWALRFIRWSCPRLTIRAPWATT
jgi:hypothetical protein